MPTPPADNRGVSCARLGCSHRYGEHAPGGGGCMYWFPLNGDHCPCVGFQWVEVPATSPPVSRRGG
jgi:hypothetical protein